MLFWDIIMVVAILEFVLAGHLRLYTGVFLQPYEIWKHTKKYINRN